MGSSTTAANPDQDPKAASSSCAICADTPIHDTFLGIDSRQSVNNYQILTKMELNYYLPCF